ncbi:MAG: acetyl-CoA carboxylase biotin carboxyl carrier protein subunit [Clostridiales bacterium]|jgi:glutaconyl-CoA decarboxylase|nr:acetyl-CoA carboxylase biotin carboxyl carrier protein subunit [Clostridiales bacterium]
MLKNYEVTVNGTKYNVTVEEKSSSYNINSAPQQIFTAPPLPSAPPALPVQAAPAPSVQSAPATPAAPSAPENAFAVECPLPGSLFKYKVAVGEKVSENQVIAIVEAMKMENEIVAPVSGTVLRLTVSEGTLLNAGDNIMLIARA